MIIAAIYPVFLWFFVFRMRRTWRGAALVACGTLAFWPIAQLVQMIGGTVTGGVIAKLVYAEMILIGLVAFWLVLMRRPSSIPLCPYCRYNLAGLPTGSPDAVCPECGNTLHPELKRPDTPFCLACGHVLVGLDPDATGQRCPACGADESEFGNWKRARAVLAKAQADRARQRRRPADDGDHGRSAR